MKRLLFLFLFLSASFNCVSAVTPTEFKRFQKEYSETLKSGGFEWSEIAYAIEMCNEEMALYCLDKLPLGSVDYKCFIIERRNIFCRCVMNNKMGILIAICNKYPNLKPNGSEYSLNQSNGTPRLQERQILNMAIGHYNALEWVKILADFGANLNICENYFVLPNSIGAKSHHRTPLQEAIVKNKLDVVEFLLERDVDPNTGLLTTVECRNLNALVLLLNYGSDPYAYNGSVIAEAIELEDDEIVEILTAAGSSNQLRPIR